MKTTAEEKLVVKELADSLGVSMRFVYEMRRCGFEMHGPTNYNHTNAREASAWIDRADFRMINGVGFTKDSVGRLPRPT